MSARPAWLLVAVQLASTVARAQPAGPPPQGEPVAPAAAPPAAAPPAAALANAADHADEARGHLELGIAAYRSHQLARAADELLEANRLAPAWPEPYRWLALAQVELDDCRSAVINIDTFVAHVPPGDPGLPELIALRGRCTGVGSVTVESAPAGATIRVDGSTPLATTPARRLALPVGSHTLTLEKQGYEPLSRSVEVRALGTDYASFALTATAPSVPLSQHWWFWTAIGALTLTGAAIAFEVARSPDPRLPGVTCTATGCHP